MQVQVKKWGNSLALRIPKILYTQAGIKEGSKINIDFENNKIIIEPVKDLTLESLLFNINEQNVHNETDTSGPIGNEIW